MGWSVRGADRRPVSGSMIRGAARAHRATGVSRARSATPCQETGTRWHYRAVVGFRRMVRSRAQREAGVVTRIPRFEEVLGPLAAAREPQPQPAARLPWPRSWTGCAPARVATTPTPRFMTLMGRLHEKGVLEPPVPGPRAPEGRQKRSAGRVLVRRGSSRRASARPCCRDRDQRSASAPVRVTAGRPANGGGTRLPRRAVAAVSRRSRVRISSSRSSELGARHRRHG